MQIPTDTIPQLIVAGFHALSDPIRINVLELLRQRELCVCDLCEALDLSQSKLSFHLKTLKEAGLVNSRQQGRWIYYRLNIPQFAILEAYLTHYSNLGQILPARPCDNIS
jgi:ArsR family transcriptional regulator, arsenate/arsenite/antimonite-responsive transcriptional repressor